VVIAPDGKVVARHGHPEPDSPIALRLPLRRRGEDLGAVIFGPKQSTLPFSSSQVELLTDAARFVAASLELGERHAEQAAALEALSAEASAVRADAATLSEALAGQRVRTGRLHVFSLGPLRVERDGDLVERWGGEKAGSRQAEACFAFLFDRGERGAAKDEFIDMIWPDMDLERADVAFHRTLNGLRTTLDPGRGGRRGDAITFHNDRYRLSESVVEWSDVAAFEASMADASAPDHDEDETIRRLERARALYRGEYFDDCPFYGDSAQVEERRELLRRRCVDLLLALGERYERRGDRPAAAASFRQARSVAGDDLPTAAEALTRLGVPA
jgi:DNA-binding SARP family transcriptional activator